MSHVFLFLFRTRHGLQEGPTNLGLERAIGDVCLAPDLQGEAPVRCRCSEASESVQSVPGSTCSRPRHMAFDDLEWVSDTAFRLGDRVWAQGREARNCKLTRGVVAFYMRKEGMLFSFWFRHATTPKRQPPHPQPFACNELWRPKSAGHGGASAKARPLLDRSCLGRRADGCYSLD